MPLVHYQHADVGELSFRIRAGQQQGQAFGGGHQGRGQAPRLALTLGAAGIAGAHAHRPGQLQAIDRRLQGALRVGSQGAHRGDPQNGQRRGWRRPLAARGCFGVGLGSESIERGQPHRVGFPGAGRGVQQAAVPIGDRLPDLFLKIEGLPAVAP